MEFMGFRRADGKVGVRNHVVVMAGCLCAQVAARKIAAATGATYLHNPNGCGQNSADRAVTLEILSGMLANGNVFSALIVGLGCEQIQGEQYLSRIAEKAEKRVEYIKIQGEGGIGKTVEKGCAIVREMQEAAAKVQRVSCDVSELILGLECGGSDPSSGLSANVVLGEVTDAVVDAGGTAVLSETPEAIGAEHILRDRASCPELGARIYNAVRDCEAYYRACGEDIRAANPSPGNMAGGITTLEEKSLGCIHKSGTRPFTGFCRYGDMIEEKGLVFMDATAYDVASVAAKIAAGAQIVVFTTGLGTPVGSAVAPVLKITGNRDTAEFLSDMIDFDTSSSLAGTQSVEHLGRQLLEKVLAVCSGEETCSEKNGCEDMAINQWHSYC